MSRFVVIEGVDGAGKTEQAKRLVERYSRAGIESEYTHEPTNGKIGRFLRLILGGRIDEPIGVVAMTHLFVADRAEHVDKFLSAALARDGVIVCDRYTPSTCVYQRKGVPMPRIADLCSRFPEPDVVVLLKVSPDVVIERLRGRGRGRDTFDSLDPEQIAMRWSAYRAALRLLGWRVLLVDGDGTPDEVEALVWEGLVEAYEEIDSDEAERRLRVLKGEELDANDPR